MQHARERCEVDIFWFEQKKERGHLEDLAEDGRIIKRCILRK
jgi:hypothetical protein